MTTPRHRTTRIAAATLTAAMLATTVGATTTAQAAPDARSGERGAVGSWVVRPGSVGPLEVGMSNRQLVRTGVFVEAGPDDVCGATVKPRKKYRAGLQYASNRARTRLTNVQVGRPTVSTARGATLGTSLGELREMYPRLSKPRRGIDHQFYVVVRDGNRFLSIGIGATGPDADDSAEVSSFGVSRGKALPVYFDGCGY